jgi:hypothetical protein
MYFFICECVRLRACWGGIMLLVQTREAVKLNFGHCPAVAFSPQTPS